MTKNGAALPELLFLFPVASSLLLVGGAAIGWRALAARQSSVRELARRWGSPVVEHGFEVSTSTRLRDRRVANACRAQVSLRDVLLSDDIASVTASINRLQTIASLMEKQSRVASWGMRTVTGPLLPAAGVITLLVVGSLSAYIGDAVISGLHYAVVGVLGAAFLYYGLKAVQLTEMSNRVWKRTAEYTLILAERKRLRQT